MKKNLILALSLISFNGIAQTQPTTTAAEEAIILNQELQFLEDSVKNVQSISINADREVQKDKALNESTLEKTYFGEDADEDVINTKTASPRRRSL
jgi:hypothetical protein